MIRFINYSIIRTFASNKPFYPFLLSPDYELLEYPDQYVSSFLIILDEQAK